MNSYSESTRPRRRCSLQCIYFKGVRRHTTAGPPQGLRGSRQRGRLTGECPRWAIKLRKQSKGVLIGHPFIISSFGGRGFIMARKPPKSV